MRLHLGCGNKRWPGFLNVDRNADAGMGAPDVTADIQKLDFAVSGSVSEIHAIHILEHLHRMDADDAVTEWFRVLERGGKLVIEVPCLDKIAARIVAGEKNIRLTTLGLFGDPRDRKSDMMHQWCYSVAELKEMLVGIGFADVQAKEPVFHIAARDMRIEARKP